MISCVSSAASASFQQIANASSVVWLKGAALGPLSLVGKIATFGQSILGGASTAAAMPIFGTVVAGGIGLALALWIISQCCGDDPQSSHHHHHHHHSNNPPPPAPGFWQLPRFPLFPGSSPSYTPGLHYAVGGGHGGVSVPSSAHVGSHYAVGGGGYRADNRPPEPRAVGADGHYAVGAGSHR